MFSEVNPKQSFPELEESVLAFWKKHKLFQKSIDQRKDGKDYTFYDGPPFATGLPHYGHILAGTIKDVIPRYYAMKGYKVDRRFGWDCHGLPVENEVEKMLDLKSKKDIEHMGVHTFNEACRSIVLKHVDDWEMVVERMGRWVDFVHDYKTMDPEYMESIWWVFKSLWDKELIYEGYKAMHICPRCETPLSNFEVTQGYKDITDQSVIAKFKLKDEENTYILAWTTTPWTLPGNTALAVGGDIDYVKVKREGEIIICAKDLYEKVFAKDLKNEDHGLEIVDTVKGSHLLGLTYEPLFDYFKDDKALENVENAYRVVAADFVSTEDGTGIVHIAPSFGEDDMGVGKAEKLPFIQHVKMDGTFTDAVKDFAGKDAKQSDNDIIRYLKEKGLVFDSQSYTHSYPHCWRCDTPLLNYGTKSWFVKIDEIKENMLGANQKIRWVPNHLKDGRFGKWLENARDWAISRDRFWGAPLPIWRCEDCGKTDCLGSMEDLFSKSNTNITKVIFVRHGESEGNVQTIRQSKEPGTSLTEKGKKQTEELAKQLKEEHSIDTIYYSPLLRTQETAEILQKATGAEIVKEDGIREIDFAEFDGKSEEEMMEFLNYRHSLSPEDAYELKLGETGESHHTMTDRMKKTMDELVAKNHQKTIVVVSHSDPIRFLLRVIKNDSLKKVYSQGHLPFAKAITYYIDAERNEIVDLHKHHMDKVTLPCECGKEMKRIPQVLDCWFESGAMPYAQVHYPFENKEAFEENFPADFIAEGLDQTRGWFYTLTVLAAALFDNPAFQNVIVNGIVLAEDGKKMSKRLKNYPEPKIIFNNYGADAMRYYMLNSQVVRAEDMRFSEKGVEEVVRKVILPLWNSYSFFVTYANIDKWKPKNDVPKIENKLDRWILSRLNNLIQEIDAEMQEYQLQRATEPLFGFIDDLTNWYIRRSRRRFWKSENDTDKDAAYYTLHKVLTEFSKLLAPFMPFTAEALYQNLVKDNGVSDLENVSHQDADSVHLCDWPDADNSSIDQSIEQEISTTQTIVALGHAARAQAKVKVRQPLQSIQIGLPENVSSDLLKEQESVIKEELNIKEIVYTEDPKDIASAYAMPDARKLGPKYGKNVQDIIKAAKSGDFEKLNNGNIKVLDYELLPDEIEIGYKGKEGFGVESAGGVVIALDLTVTNELKKEGVARDLVRTIQDMRKEADYHVADRICIGISGADDVVKKFGDYIRKETLGLNISESLQSPDKEKEVEIEGQKVVVMVEKD